MLTSEAIFEFMDSFFGYGNLEAPIWFLGMEEVHAPRCPHTGSNPDPHATHSSAFNAACSSTRFVAASCLSGG